MKYFRLSVLIFIVITVADVFIFSKADPVNDTRFLSYTVNPAHQQLQFFWKDDQDQRFGSIANLQSWLAMQNKKLVFAMNGGMYKTDHSPVGLYVEKSTQLAPTDTSSGTGNFYLKPNGIFYLTNDRTAAIATSTDFIFKNDVAYATQSGPMLVIDGNIHPAFDKTSTNTNIRNGVGILPGNKILFVMSKSPVNFHDFAKYFRDMGCKNALYLDGLVSRTYLPQKNWKQTDGNFGVIVGVVEKD